MSEVTKLLELVWKNANDATSHSWERLNHSMRAALKLAVGSGFEFGVADFEGLPKFNYNRWIGDSAEWVYSLAIAEGNYSAAVAYEQWKSRDPLIADDVTCAGHEFAHTGGRRQSERLHVGCKFPWKGEPLCTVTSFSKDGSAVACVYHKPTKGKYESKVSKRYRITRADIISNRAERKERQAIHDKVFALVEAGKFTAEHVIGSLGVKSRSEFESAPIEKIRKNAAKLISDVA